MTRDQAIEILETIAELYPRFELTERKAQILLPGLQRMEFQGVMRNLEKHVSEKPYPPTLAEIASYQAEENLVLDRIRQYEEEARRNPPTEEQKAEFKRRMARLFRRGVNHE